MMDLHSPDSKAAEGEVDWLTELLPHHPIFSLPSHDNDASLLQPGCPSKGAGRHSPSEVEAQRKRLMEVRSTELLVAVNLPATEERKAATQIRIASLLEAKKAQSQPSSNALPSYKTFSPAIPFPVKEIRANHTGKLLAVIGATELHICILPRPGWLHNAKLTVAIKSLPVGRFYHNEGTAAIAKADWHPWAQGGSSLMVLTDDGVLREYDVSTDHEEPAQTLSFLPNAQLDLPSRPPYGSRSRSTRSPSASFAGFKSRFERSGTPGSVLTESIARLGLDDEPSATRAVSFAFGPGVLQPPTGSSSTEDPSDTQLTANFASEGPAWGGWSPLELYGAMQNGDVWKLCPFLPSKALVPPSLIHHLTSYVELQAQTHADAGKPVGKQLDLAMRYTRGLAQQAAKAKQRQQQRDTSVSFATESPAPAINARKRSSAMSMTPTPAAGRSLSVMSVDTPALPDTRGGDDSFATLDSDAPVLVQPPPLPLTPQVKAVGPHLLKPAPHELSEEREALATDLTVTRVTSHRSGPQLDVLLIAMDDGRVDVCIRQGGGQAAWETKSPTTRRAPTGARAKRSRTASLKKAGRFTLSDSDDTDEDEADEELSRIATEEQLNKDEPLPQLLVYESIDLGLGPSARTAASFVIDPIYSDTVYLYQSKGVFALSFRPWAARLASLIQGVASAKADSHRDLLRFLHRRVGSELVQVVQGGDDDGPGVCGLAVLSDVYLSYAMLALTNDLQPIGIELDFRVEMDAHDPEAEDGADKGAGDVSFVGRIEENPAYISLLAESGAFKVPEPFSSYKGLPIQPRITGQHKFGKGEVTVTPDSMRFLGTFVDSMRKEIREIVKGGNASQARLELQQKELARQLEKLTDVQKRSATAHVKHAGLQDRFNLVEKKQSQLNRRIDGLLQKLIVLHQPEISIYERRYFDELDRLAKEHGVSTTATTAAAAANEDEYWRGAEVPAGSIKRKIQQLTTQLNLIKPELEHLRDSQNLREATRQSLGTSQTARISKALAEQSAQLLDAKEKAQFLLSKVPRGLA